MPKHPKPMATDLKEHLTLGKYLELAAPMAEDIARLDRKLDEFRGQIITEVRNIVLTSEDRIMGELKKLQENQDTALYRQVEHSDLLENHEKRLITLENKHKIN